VLGAAAAPILVGLFADIWNLRVAFLLASPPVYVGAYVLYRARDHIEEDAGKILEAVMIAVQEEQARAESEAAET
jgi:MFS family permease